MLTTRKALYPGAGPQFGTYRVQFDSRRRHGP